MKMFLSILNFVASVTFSGWVFSVLWGWFIVATFGLTPLTIPAAIGVQIVVAYASKTLIKPSKDNSIDHVEWVKPIVCLVVGGIVKLFM